MHRMSDREQRAAKNEATAREINEQIDDAHDASPPDRQLPMVCECGYATCEQVVAITPAEYARLRSNPHHFAVLADHVIPDVERTVFETDRYVVVSKRDQALRDDIEPEGGTP